MSKFNQNVAVIGCGYWGTIIVNNLKKIVTKKIYIFDKNFENLLNLKKKIPSVILVNNLDELIKNKKINNFFLITPPSENFSIIKKLIYHKKNIFIEKPGLLKKKKFNEIIKLNKKNKNIIMIGYIYLFNKNIRIIKKIIKNKKLGKILFIKSLRENLGPIRTDVDCNFDLASHDISILKYLFEDKINIKRVIKHKILNKRNTDISTINSYIKNINIEIKTSWLNPEKIRKLIIIGSKKMLVYNEMEERNKILIYNQYANYPKIKKFNKIIFSNVPKIYKGSFKSIKSIKNDPLKDEINHFFKCIKLNKKPLTDIYFGKNILETLLKIKIC